MYFFQDFHIFIIHFNQLCWYRSGLEEYIHHQGKSFQRKLPGHSNELFCSFSGCFCWVENLYVTFCQRWDFSCLAILSVFAWIFSIPSKELILFPSLRVLDILPGEGQYYFPSSWLVTLCVCSLLLLFRACTCSSPELSCLLSFQRATAALSGKDLVKEREIRRERQFRKSSKQQAGIDTWMGLQRTLLHFWQSLSGFLFFYGVCIYVWLLVRGKSRRSIVFQSF